MSAAVTRKLNDSASDDGGDCTQYKLVVIGDGAVGKTSLCIRLAEDRFARSYKVTIGVDFFSKQLKLPGGRTAAVQLWDIGGQTLSSKMVANYMYGAHAILLVYDITNKQSFQDLTDWVGMVKQVFSTSLPYLALVANKADLTHTRVVDPSQHVAFADTLSMSSFFVSAKTGDNVAAALYRIVADLCGLPLTAVDISNAVKVVPAQVINDSQQCSEDSDTHSATVSARSKCCMM